MKKLDLEDVAEYIRNNIGTFHKKRIQGLEKLKLKTVLEKKNPYLFKAKHLLTADSIIKSLTDAYISSKEETIFGDWLEGLAIHINMQVYNGWKSGIKGIDLEFDKDGTRYIVNIKSGPNWGNSSQIEKMKSDFIAAKRTLRTSNSGIRVNAVNGCCYGRDSNQDKGEYFKLCGQEFWSFISGDDNLYLDLIKPLGHNAKQKNDDFLNSYSAMINKFTIEFGIDFCTDSGNIDWDKLVKYNSGR